MIRKKKSTIKRKTKEKIYKYLVSYKFDGDVQKVIVEQEGKKEAIIRMKSWLGGKTIIGNRILKETNTHSLCSTIEEANIKYKQYILKRIKYHKEIIKNLNNTIKEML